MSRNSGAAKCRKIGTAFYNRRLIQYAPWPLLVLIVSDVLFYGLRVVPGFERVSLFVLHHHEAFNGAGYPAGLTFLRRPSLS